MIPSMHFKAEYPPLFSWCSRGNKSLVIASASNKIGQEIALVPSKVEIVEFDHSPLPKVSFELSSQCEKIIWTKSDSNSSNFIVASLEDGQIEAFNCSEMSENGNGRLQVHNFDSKPVRGLCSSRFQPNLIAASVLNDEIRLFDLNNLPKISKIPLTRNEFLSETNNLSWNPKVPHILAISSVSGLLSIVDLRSKKEVSSIHLPSFDRVSSISWSPETPTCLAVGSNEDSRPFVYIWDLKNPSMEKLKFTRHDSGISSISWSSNGDSIISTGPSSGTFLWNPISSEVIQEYPDLNGVTVDWCPVDENQFAISSENGLSIISTTLSDYLDSNDILINSEQQENSNNGSLIGASFGGANICASFGPASKRVSLQRLLDSDTPTIITQIEEFESSINSNMDYKFFDNLSSQDLEISRLFKLIKFSSLIINNNDFSSLHELFSLFTNIDEPRSSEPRKESEKFISSNISDLISENKLQPAASTLLQNGDVLGALLLTSSLEDDSIEEIEDFVFKNPTYFQECLIWSINRKNASKLAQFGPVNQWRAILTTIIFNSAPEFIESSLKVFSRRAYEMQAYHVALIFAYLANDFEFSFLIFFKHLSKTESFRNISEHANYLFDHYRILLIFDYLNSLILKNLCDTEVKTQVLEVILKLNSILFSYGLKSDILMKHFDHQFYSAELKGKNQEIDEFVDAIQNLSIGTFENPAKAKHESNSSRPIFSLHQSQSITPTILPAMQRKTYEAQSYSSKNIAPLSPINKNYNDAPIINVNISKISTKSVPEDLNNDVVSRGLQLLIEAAEQRATSVQIVRMVQDNKAKLTSAFVLKSLNYDGLKSVLASLFNELNCENFETASNLATNILATFFVETKEWILPLKRLVEIAKTK